MLKLKCTIQVISRIVTREYQYWCKKYFEQFEVQVILFRKHFQTYNITLVSQELTTVYRKEADAWFSVGHFPELDLSFQLWVYQSGGRDLCFVPCMFQVLFPPRRVGCSGPVQSCIMLLVGYFFLILASSFLNQLYSDLDILSHKQNSQDLPDSFPC